jgi:hypothetical protein
MAKKPDDKKPDDKNASAPVDAASASMNKAQAEYQHYLKRMQGHNQGGMQGYIAVPAGNEGVPGWAIPPSVAMLPNGSAGYYAAMPQGGSHGQGSLTHSLGSTIRLGVDVVNAALAGGVRLLNGISGAAYGYGEQGHGHQGCGCGCNSCGDDCCGDDCCGHDCCGCECCQPGVGSCC